MGELPAQDVLELSASNFGPIVEANITLRPLTVFVGPSNTGKSYLAILIYALHRYFNDGGMVGRSHIPIDFRMLDYRGAQKEVLSHLEDTIDTVAQQILHYVGDSRSKEDIVFPDALVDIIRSGLHTQGSYLGNEIGRCFGIDEIGALVRKGMARNANVAFRRHGAGDSASIENQLTIDGGTSCFTTIIPEGLNIRVRIADVGLEIHRLRSLATRVLSQPELKNERRLGIPQWNLLDFLTACVHPQIGGPLSRPAFYLPADRTGVMHAHRAVVSALIGNAAMAGLNPTANTATLSGVLADFLKQLINLESRSYRRHKSIRGLDAQIEDSILGGAIGVDKSVLTGYPHFTYSPKGWKDSLSLMNSSSMVSELAPVVLYLRHIVRPGNVLIVEEPESHLHPAMQVEFTRQLATLVKKGIRVIITTHSEWVIEELSNIVGRSKLPIRQAGADDQDGKIKLRSDQVGAWLFKQRHRPRGSIVEELRFDDETGLYPTDYEVVSEELYNESVNIYNDIQNQNSQ